MNRLTKRCAFFLSAFTQPKEWVISESVVCLLFEPNAQLSRSRWGRAKIHPDVRTYVRTDRMPSAASATHRTVSDWFSCNTICMRKKVHLRRRTFESIMYVIGLVLLFRIGDQMRKKRAKICIHVFRIIPFCSPSVDANWKKRFCYTQRVYKERVLKVRSSSTCRHASLLNFAL
jgi:hypothetical protein